MVKFAVLVTFVFLSISTPKVESEKIENKISDYFSSSTVKQFFDMWKKSRKGYETSVAAFLKESYGASGGSMNVYVRRDSNLQELCTGYYVNDNIVGVLLVNMYLRELPLMLMPDVSLSLANNVVRIETKLNKMFIDANYILMRNHSDLVFEDTDPFSSSPFARQQVQTRGLVTIIAEDCHLIGEAVVTLTGVSPHLGHHMFRIVNCKFSIEIFQPGSPSPPVIAPYFSKTQSYQLQHMMSVPICSEVAAKLQGVFVSLMNTSAIFGDETYQFRSSQKKIFKDTEKYMSTVVRQLNKASIRENQGVVAMEKMEIMFDEGHMTSDKETHIRIEEVTMNGLDMAYASLRGGPIKMSSVKIIDEIRFYRLQIRGKLHFENATSKGIYDFAAELLDLPVSVQIRIGVGDSKNNAKATKTLEKFDVKRWRELIYSPGNLWNVRLRKFTCDTLILGYLIREVPNAVANHLEAVFQQAIDADSEDRKNELSQYDEIRVNDK